MLVLRSDMWVPRLDVLVLRSGMLVLRSGMLLPGAGDQYEAREGQGEGGQTQRGEIISNHPDVRYKM
eukprot:681144-Rhodomonas_salina.1